ncbi:Probable WRKY transcription factor 32 [Striga hermonthica]|uniref:Probable WRKY transcription factor 32 n=1 Tax=Striga hermonthica TaxID=68872 RepID=A0A9N7R1A6_STRHE|nr:Probable WRKY transcription factor 32 [Striga hermonthica]
MVQENSLSSECLQGTEDDEHLDPVKEKIELNKMANNCEKERVSSESMSDCTIGSSSRIESRTSQLETLTSVQLSEAALADFDESSHLLSEVPVEYSLQPIQSAEQLKEQAKAAYGQSLKSVTGTFSEVRTPVSNATSKLEVSPASATKSVCSIPNLLPVKNGNNTCITEQDKQNFPGSKPSSKRAVQKTSDGYNWRKYGQKPVKSPEGSRSYYRCTFFDCYAKKIEFCDSSHRLIETVYRSHHNHDPLPKLNCTNESVPALPVGPVSGDDDSFRPMICSNGQVKDNKLKQSIPGTNEMPETQKHESSDSDETTEANMEEYIDGAECRKRQERNSAGDIDSPSKSGKKPKYVVHAAGDMGISGDGYRWRKYGQKMVKGNPHPRNYFRCTSGGCPVRKHIERAVDNMNDVVITYKGVHDHSTPLPRKHDVPKSNVVADSRLTQWSMDKGGVLRGEDPKVVGDKESESAGTLEIKPC